MLSNFQIAVDTREGAIATGAERRQPQGTQRGGNDDSQDAYKAVGRRPSAGHGNLQQTDRRKVISPTNQDIINQVEFL